MTRGGGVNVTTNWQTRDEGSNKEGKDNKGNGNTTALVAMDSATVTAMDGNKRQWTAVIGGSLAVEQRQQQAVG
jgi:hypothetical protein